MGTSITLVPTISVCKRKLSYPTIIIQPYFRAKLDPSEHFIMHRHGLNLVVSLLLAKSITSVYHYLLMVNIHVFVKFLLILLLVTYQSFCLFFTMSGSTTCTCIHFSVDERWMKESAVTFAQANAKEK